MRNHDHRVARAKRNRVMHQLKGLFAVRQQAPTRELAHPTLRHARRVQRSPDPHESDALLPRHGIRRAFDFPALPQHPLDQFRLRVNRFVNVVRMSRTHLRHLLSLRSRYIGSVVFAAAHISETGAGMPRYLSQHTLACLTRQGAEELARRVHAAKEVTARRVLVNMQEGKMLVEFDAPGREEMEKWLAAEKFHFDWLLRIEFETSDGALKPIT